MWRPAQHELQTFVKNLGVPVNQQSETHGRDAPHCPTCNAALHYSHVEYGGRGSEVPVLRCSGCGSVVRGRPRPRQARTKERSSRRTKAPIDEGPPANPVIDPEIARRLLGGD
jgi:hypothetical protein